jgi:Fe-S-cluster-containing dehydrogenase component
MARMKFLSDAERCIECNACVTACKNENEIPWGVNRRRVVTINDGKPGERSITVACMHCSDPPCMAVCPVDVFYQTDEGVVLHSKDLCIGCGYCFYACPFGAPQFPQVGNFGSRGKMDSVPSAPAGRRRITPRPSSRSTDATVWPKASCRSARKCARPRLCWRATAISCPISTASAWSPAVSVPALGAGGLPISRSPAPRREKVGPFWGAGPGTAGIRRPCASEMLTDSSPCLCNSQSGI